MSTVIVGVGNAYRRDDGAGLAVAELLEGHVPAGVGVVASEHEPTRLLDAWQDADTVLLVDAVRSGAAPGTIHCFDASREPVPADVFRASTHAFGLGDAIELARALGRLPRRVLVYGIEGSAFDAGEELTPAVEAAAERAAAAILAELEEATCTSGR